MNGLDERDEESLVLLKEYALEDDDKLTESALRLKRGVKGVKRTRRHDRVCT